MATKATTKAVATKAPAKASTRKASPVHTANTGKGLLLSDLNAISTLWGTDATTELAKVRLIGSLNAKGFSARAIADGATVRLGAKAPRGFNKSTVAIYASVAKGMTATAPAKGSLTEAQSVTVADMLLTIAGAQDADGGAAKGLAKALEAAKASTTPAKAVQAIKAVHTTVTAARSKRLATPAVRPVAGTPAIGQAPAKDADAPAAPAAPAPAPAKDAVSAASPARLIAELTKRFNAKGASIPADVREAFDALAVIVEGLETVTVKV